MSFDRFSCDIHVGRNDGDHHQGDAKCGGAAEAGHKQPDGACDFKDAGENCQKIPRWKDGRDDGSYHAWMKEVERDARDEERKRCQNAQQDLRHSKARKPSAGHAEEGRDGENKQEDWDCIFHGG